MDRHDATFVRTRKLSILFSFLFYFQEAVTCTSSQTTIALSMHGYFSAGLSPYPKGPPHYLLPTVSVVSHQERDPKDLVSSVTMSRHLGVC